MDVTEELTDFEDQIDRAHIERRIEDWRRRLSDLYSDVTSWLPPGWSARERDDVTMHELLMRSFGIEERRLPSLVLTKESLAARLEPRGLWIIGANGRVDLVSFEGHYVIIDPSELYEAPRWTISVFRDQLHPRRFTRDALVQSLP